jgi:O-antigen/teichoic acid export membrane protein
MLSLPLQGREGRREVKEVLHVSWPLLVTNLTLFGLIQADVWILGVFRGQEEVAIYGAASRLASLIFLITSVLYAVLPPIVAVKYARNEKESLESLLQGSATVATLFASPILLTFAVFSGSVLGLVYGSYYESGRWVLAVLSVGLFVNVATGIRGYVLMMAGDERAQLLIAVAGGVANVVLCSLGAIYLGMLGVALGAMVSMIGQCTTELLVVYHRLGIRTHAYLRPVKNIRRLITAQGNRSS